MRATRLVLTKHLLLLPFLALAWVPAAMGSEPVNASASALFARSNLVAWCIVPFDAKKRGPEERAAMLAKLGLKHLAYDYRAEHVSTFDAELQALKRHGINLAAWWFPGVLNEEAKLTLDLFKRQGVSPDLWITGGGEPAKTPEEQKARVAAEGARIKTIAQAAAPLGCRVALYNHGGWFGEPENQIQIIDFLRQTGITNVGIVYNLHHGHDHLDRFPALLRALRPHLFTLNLNGMDRDGEKAGRKILPLGEGKLDLTLLREIAASGWRGPIGILNHTDEDAEARLQDNLDGLAWLLDQLAGKPASAKPRYRSFPSPSANQP